MTSSSAGLRRWDCSGCCPTPPSCGEDAIDRSQAWRTYDQLWADERVLWADEPAELDAVWRTISARDDKSHKLWTDDYLAAFAQASDHVDNSRPQGTRPLPFRSGRTAALLNRQLRGSLRSRIARTIRLPGRLPVCLHDAAGNGPAGLVRRLQDEQSARPVENEGAGRCGSGSAPRRSRGHHRPSDYCRRSPRTTTVRTLRQLAARRTWLRTRAGLPSGKPASLSSRRINVTWCSGVSGGVTCPASSLLRISRGARLLAVFAVAVAAPCSVLAGPGAAASPRVAVPPAGTISTLAGTVGGPGPARSVAVAPCGRESRYRLCGLAFAGGHLYATDAGADNDGGLAVGCLVRSISISGG